jgi:hypothetical protein
MSGWASGREQSRAARLSSSSGLLPTMRPMPWLSLVSWYAGKEGGKAQSRVLKEGGWLVVGHARKVYPWSRWGVCVESRSGRKVEGSYMALGPGPPLPFALYLYFVYLYPGAHSHRCRTFTATSWERD